MLRVPDLQINFPKVRHTCPECQQDLAGYVDRCIVISSGNCPYCGKRILEQVCEQTNPSDPPFQFAELEQAHASWKKQTNQDAVVLILSLFTFCLYSVFGFLFLTLFEIAESIIFWCTIVSLWLITFIVVVVLIAQRLRKRENARPNCPRCRKNVCNHWDISKLTGRCWFCANELIGQKDLPIEKVIWKPKHEIIISSNWKETIIFLTRFLLMIFFTIVPLLTMLKLIENIPLHHWKNYLLSMAIVAIILGYVSWRVNKTWIRKYKLQSHIPENQCPACKNFHANGPLAMATKRCPDCRVQFVESEAEPSD